jgi:cytochrome c553
MNSFLSQRTTVLRRSHVLLAIALSVAAVPALARDAQAGRAKSQACMVCHGPVGISMAPDAPNLAGQPALYVTAQLKAYRAGERRHEVMAVIARMLSDDDIENLAAWYASIRVEAQAPD